MANGATQGLIDRIAKIIAAITTVTGFIGGLVGFFNLAAGNAQLVFRIVLYGSLLLLWISCFYIYLAKKPKPKTALIQRPAPTSAHSFTETWRRAALVGIFGIPCATLITLGAIWYYESLPQDKVVVLFAKFDSKDQATSDTYDKILGDLRNAISKYRPKVELLNYKVITEEEGGNDAARAAGQQRRANIVIWGLNSKNWIRANFLVLVNKPSYLSREQNLEFPLTGQETFKVQISASEDISFLTLLTLGLVRFEADDWDGAVNLLNDALAHANGSRVQQDEAIKKDNQATCHFILGRALMSQGKYDQAIASYRQAVQLKPDYGEAHLYLGYTYFINGKSEAAAELATAIDFYSASIRGNPQAAEPYINRGTAYSYQGFTAAQDQHFPEAEEKISLALSDYDKSINLQSDNPLAYNNRGVAYIKKGDVELEMRRADPANQSYDLAISDFNRALKLSPWDISVRNNRGTAFSKRGKFDQALADYSEVIKHRPNNPLSYLNRAFVYYDKFDYKRALEDYNQAINLDGGIPRIYRNRGWAHMFLGQYEQAAQDAQTFLNLKGQCDKGFKDMVILGYLGYRMANRQSEADTILNRAGGCDPSWPFDLLRYLHNDIDQRQLLEAARNNSALTEAHTYIGMSLLFSGQTGAALEHFKWVNENGDKTYDEYHLSRAQIKLLSPGALN
jgi:tetratricopeptide (TPR) repeat protein